MTKSKGRRCGAGFEISSARESLISALVSSGFHHQEFLVRKAASYLFCCVTEKWHLIFFLTFGDAFYLSTSSWSGCGFDYDSCPLSELASLRPVTAVLTYNSRKKVRWMHTISSLYRTIWWRYLISSSQQCRISIWELCQIFLLPFYNITSNKSTEPYYKCGNIRCLPEQSKPDGRSQFKTAVSW